MGRYMQRGEERRGVWERAHVNKSEVVKVSQVSQVSQVSKVSKPKSKQTSKPGSNEKDKHKHKEKDMERDGEADGDGMDGHSNLDVPGYKNGIPPWGVFLFPVPLIFGIGNGGGEGDPNQDQDHICVSVDASQVKAPGGCASVSALLFTVTLISFLYLSSLNRTRRSSD